MISAPKAHVVSKRARLPVRSLLIGLAIVFAIEIVVRLGNSVFRAWTFSQLSEGSGDHERLLDLLAIAYMVLRPTFILIFLAAVGAFVMLGKRLPSMRLLVFGCAIVLAAIACLNLVLYLGFVVDAEWQPFFVGKSWRHLWSALLVLELTSVSTVIIALGRKRNQNAHTLPVVVMVLAAITILTSFYAIYAGHAFDDIYLQTIVFRLPVLVWKGALVALLLSAANATPMATDTSIAAGESNQSSSWSTSASGGKKF